MGFVRQRPLGLFIVDDLMAGAAAVKGIQAIASSAGTFLNPGASRDAQRKARADYVGQSAMAGSVTAARYLLGGMQNVGSNERPFYQTWINQLAGDFGGVGSEVLAAAQAQGPKWPAGVPDPGGTEQMFGDIKRDLVQLSQPAPGATWTPTPSSGGFPPIPSSSGNAQTLPTMYTVATAPKDWTPYLIAGGVGLAALALGAGKRRGRR